MQFKVLAVVNMKNKVVFYVIKRKAMVTNVSETLPPPVL
jgi:hypothetical protein